MTSKITRYYSEIDSFELNLPQGQEGWISMKAREEDSMFKRLRQMMDGLDGTILSHFVMAGCSHFEQGMAEMKPVDWPVTWIQGDACDCGEVYSSQLNVLSGIAVQPIFLNDRNIGYVYENEDARFCRLCGLLPQDCSASREVQARSVFDRMAAVLEENGMHFSDTVRTWLYLDRLLEWYDPFNAVRSAFFAEQGVAGRRIPASTGIGAANPQGAALVADLLAVSPKTQACRIEVLPSPLQCPAVDYKSSFSRAVELSFPMYRQILVSGTASIDPQGASAHLNDTRAQIELTMQVVHAILTSRAMGWEDLSRGIAYFKNRADIVLWEEWVLKNNLPRFPLGVSHADVCREDLLFEIEVDAVQLT